MTKFATYYFRYSQEDLFPPREWENRQQHAQAEAAVMEMLNGMKHMSGDIENKRKEVVA
jgi:hypothetical protein